MDAATMVSCWRPLDGCTSFCSKDFFRPSSLKISMLTSVIVAVYSILLYRVLTGVRPSSAHLAKVQIMAKPSVQKLMQDPAMARMMQAPPNFDFENSK